MRKITSLIFVLLSVLTLQAQDYSQIYLIGDATPNGWDREKSQKMEQVSGEDGIFTWEGQLKEGSFRFISQTNDWWPGFIAANNGQIIETGNTYDILYSANGDPDRQFIVSTTGSYKITVNLKALKMTVDESSVEVPTELWLVGDALSDGPVKMSVDPKGRFYYNGALSKGSIKAMSTATEQSGTIYYVPKEEDVDIQDGVSFKTTTDANDAGYNVTVASDYYRIKLDYSTSSFSGSPFRAPENLYLIGGATEAGWSLEKSVPFEADSENPYVFICTAELKNRPENEEPNLFKILGQKDWGPYSLHPFTPNESILDSQYVLENEGDDKWSVPDDKQGEYKITVDTFHGTVKSEYNTFTGIRVITCNPAEIDAAIMNGNIVVTSANIIKRVSLSNIRGQQVACATASSNEVMLKSNLSPAIYLLTVQTSDGSIFTKKIAIK